MNLHDYLAAPTKLVPLTANRHAPAALAGRPRLVTAAVHDDVGRHLHDLVLTVVAGEPTSVEATCGGRNLRLTVRLDQPTADAVALDVRCDQQVGIWRRRARGYASAGATVTLRCDDGLVLRVRVR